MAATAPVCRVLILTFAYWEGLSRLPAVLHQAGCEVSVFGPPANYPALSRYVTHRTSVAGDMEQLLDYLQQYLAQPQHQADWIVIGDDPLLYALEKRQQQSWVQHVLRHCIAPDKLGFATSKIQFLQACQSAGILVPAFQICHTRQDLQQAAQRFGFPLVLKEAQGYAGLAVRILHRMEECAQIDLSHAWIAQEFITGRLLSASAVFRHGQLLSLFSYYRSRTWGELGPSAAIQFQSFPGLDHIVQSSGKLSGFHGLCGFDLIQQEGSGDLYLLEQNFRPTLTLDLGRLAGVDVVGAIKRMLAGEPVPDEWRQSAQNEKQLAVIPLFPQDVFRALDAGDLSGLLRWVWDPRYWSYLRWHEPRIALRNWRHVMAKLRQNISRLLRFSTS
ncbi:ATP-grasp domain-containing protein [Undibacterium sp. BYS50W]|nr:ATP-grasp domain-containing protein [Undibacterium rugosum]